MLLRPGLRRRRAPAGKPGVEARGGRCADRRDPVSRLPSAGYRDHPPGPPGAAAFHRGLRRQPGLLGLSVRPQPAGFADCRRRGEEGSCAGRRPRRQCQRSDLLRRGHRDGAGVLRRRAADAFRPEQRRQRLQGHHPAGGRPSRTGRRAAPDAVPRGRERPLAPCHRPAARRHRRAQLLHPARTAGGGKAARLCRCEQGRSGLLRFPPGQPDDQRDHPQEARPAGREGAFDPARLRQHQRRLPAGDHDRADQPGTRGRPQSRVALRLRYRPVLGDLPGG